MSQSYSASGSLIFYSGKNYAGSMQPINYGQTGVLAASGTEWNYQSVAMSNMHAFCWSQVNTSDNGVNYQNHIESIVSASIPDLTVLYSESQFPLQYLGVDPAKATPVWFDMSAIAGETDAMASTALAGGSTITTLSRPGINGVAAFIETVSGSSVVATCSFGHYDSVSGEISWTGLNAGTLVLEYTGGSVTLLAATGFPEGWALDTPRPQADGSWVIALSGGDAGKDVIGNLSSDKLSIENDGKDAATLTVTVVNAATDEPTAGVSVTWSTTLGKLSASTSVTGTDGTATVTLTDSGDTGSATVTAVLDDGESASCTVAVADASDSYKVSLTSDKNSIVNNGTDRATLTATVVDSAQLPVPGVTVSWETTLGTVSASASVTGSDGKATVSLTDNGAPGTATVTASITGDNDSVDVSVTDSSLGYTIVTLTSDVDTIVNDGSEAATLTATVHDGEGNIVPGVAVYWDSTQGTLSHSEQNTDINGQSQTALNDTGDTGQAAVTATLDNGSSKTYYITLTQSVPPFIIRGNRTSNRASCQAVEGRLVALDAVTLQPVQVEWSYDSGAAGGTGSDFLDSSPQDYLNVSLGGKNVVTLNPSNILGNGEWTDTSVSAGAFTARLNDGTCVGWGLSNDGGVTPSAQYNYNVATFSSTFYAFTALREDQSVFCWGNTNEGGQAPSGILSLKDIQEVRGTRGAFALRTLTSPYIRTWGWGTSGGEAYDMSVPSNIASMADIISLVSTDNAFAVITSSGRVYAWGDPASGGSASGLNGISTCKSSRRAFAVISGGRIHAWGDKDYGGDSSAVSGIADGVRLIATESAFTVMRANGGIDCWGNKTYGNSMPQSYRSRTDIVDVKATYGAFAALCSDGTVLTWGNSSYGGDSSSVISQLKNVVSLSATSGSFAALKRDGTLVTWGNQTMGGNSSTVTQALHDIYAVYANTRAFCALRSDSTVVVWGDSTSGTQNIPPTLNGNISYLKN
jgi:hypothetical protein